MPFDPDDPSDVRTWASDQMTKRRWSGGETVAYIVKRIVWAAQKTTRRQSRCAPMRSMGPERTGGSSGFMADVEVADPWDLAAPANHSDDLETAEELLVSAMATVTTLLAPMRLCSQRKALATLSCLARVVHVVKSCLSERAASRFTDGLFRHLTYLQLPVNQDTRCRFENVIRRLRDTGNCRRDLAEVGWPCPGNDQWTEFVKSWEQHRTARSEHY